MSENERTPQDPDRIDVRDGPGTNENDEDLARRLDEAEAQRDEYLNLLKAKQAEFENYQKRSTREREQESRFAPTPLVRELLPALDNMELALDAAKKTGDEGPLVQGVQAIYSQILDAFRRSGVTRIDALGQTFDPNLHEAVGQLPTTEHPPQTVVQVYRPGYVIHDRVIRPATVIVSVAPPEPDSTPESDSGSDGGE